MMDKLCMCSAQQDSVHTSWKNHPSVFKGSQAKRLAVKWV